MSIFDHIISLAAPYECLGCERQGSLLCVACGHRLPKMNERCYSCRKPTFSAATCLACRSTSNLERVHVATVYEDIAKDLVWKLKFDGAQAAAGIMAANMKFLLKNGRSAREIVLVPVPTATSRVRQRGYDQADLLARALSRELGLPRLKCLARLGQTHQIGAGRRQRLQQLTSAFVVKKSVFDTHIVLVDDVVTTGATLEAAAQVLKNAGAQHISALVFASPL